MTDRVRQRRAVRVVLSDPRSAVLLLQGADPARPEAGSWWHVPGGGVEVGETLEEAARREVKEETGLALGELGPVVWRRLTRYTLAGVEVAQQEAFFVVEVPHFTPQESGWTELERRWMSGWRWWGLEELRCTGETFYPRDLLERLEEWRGATAAPPQTSAD